MTPQRTILLLRAAGGETSMCGSRVTVNPCPEDSDTDILCYCRNEGVVSSVVNSLTEESFYWEGDTEHYQQLVGSDFISMRWPMDAPSKRDTINVIVTANREFFLRHIAATLLCRDLNLKTKTHRVAIFEAVLYGDRKSQETEL